MRGGAERQNVLMRALPACSQNGNNDRCQHRINNYIEVLLHSSIPGRPNALFVLVIKRYQRTHAG
jgi:hypothetical protein